MIAAAAGANPLQGPCAGRLRRICGTRAIPPRALIPERPEQYPSTALRDGTQPAGNKTTHHTMATGNRHV